MHRLHLSVSMWSYIGGVVLIEASIVGGIIKAVSKHLVPSLRKGLVGLAFLTLGFLYASYFALPIPAAEMSWFGHIFVSTTLLLAGLGLVIMSLLGKMLAKKALHQTNR